MNYEALVSDILEKVGTRENVLSATNCMTRLRITVKDERLIDADALKQTEGVLGLVRDRKNHIEIVVGPGKSGKCGAVLRQLGIPAAAPAAAHRSTPAATETAASAAAAQKSTPTATETTAAPAPQFSPSATQAAASDWQQNKAEIQARQKSSRLRDALKIFGEIFIPLIPGVIAAGLCAGLRGLIQQLSPGWAEDRMLNVVCTFLSLIQTSFLAYLTAWGGYRAAERFGGTPVLGGMLGMITGLDGINTLSQAVGWWNEAMPLDSTLQRGRGGILAAVLGVLVMVKIEKWIRRRMPDALDVVFTPLLTLLVCLIPYVFVIMPVCGLVSGWICSVVELVCMSPNLFVRIFAGYVSAAVFLPLVAIGMHHGMVAIYSVQLEQLGYITLYPTLCMAGAGQVGAAAALWLKARKTGNKRLCQVIAGALPAGILGIGEPLIYGVTLPLGTPFVTAGLGAGFGGAFVMATQVAATTWGTSGILGVFVMTAGPGGSLMSILCYLAGLLISAAAAFLITAACVPEAQTRA